MQDTWSVTLDPLEKSKARNRTWSFRIAYLNSHQKRENLKDLRRRKSQRPNIRAEVCNFEIIESREAGINSLLNKLNRDKEIKHQKDFKRV